MKLLTSTTLALILAPCHAAVVGYSSKALRHVAPPAEREEVVLPVEFDQQLLVCNAYSGSSPVSIKRNGHDAQADERGIQYKECRRIAGPVRSKDKLDFVFGSGIQGSFEIGALPDTDATLLLVVQRRDATSPLVAFQSFAFPSRRDSKEAQLAVIDTYKGKSNLPHLRMEDHVNDKETKTVSKRIEQLNFNHIYVIEEGTYDASISDHVLTGESADQMTQQSKKTLHLSKNQNYVVLRTGDDKHSEQSLMIFPEVHSSALRSATVSCVLVALLARTLL